MSPRQSSDETRDRVFIHVCHRTESDLRHFLESAVLQAGANLADEDEDDDRPADDERSEDDQRMTDAFRAFSD